MIRRAPTTIKLTPEDVLDYDDEKLRQQQQLQLQKQLQPGQSRTNSQGGLYTASSFNQNSINGSQDSVLQRLQSIKSKDERIGVRSNR
ncbi:hypothetical protein WICPIJ_002896 [Wickerhamomyces pijperi]|uniref:Uncharacterized protein n=1 Tax=Wickerhamomyces pijperi TaxID=599730 RepID=A0A9P8Q850_WICPI|nr:hypothetical protein WICPIJ_002896 [Wickerhamomyces pijperi]